PVTALGGCARGSRWAATPRAGRCTERAGRPLLLAAGARKKEAAPACSGRVREPGPATLAGGRGTENGGRKRSLAASARRGRTLYRTKKQPGVAISGLRLCIVL